MHAFVAKYFEDYYLVIVKKNKNRYVHYSWKNLLTGEMGEQIDFVTHFGHKFFMFEYIELDKAEIMMRLKC